MWLSERESAKSLLEGFHVIVKWLRRNRRWSWMPLSWTSGKSPFKNNSPQYLFYFLSSFAVKSCLIESTTHCNLLIIPQVIGTLLKQLILQIKTARSKIYFNKWLTSLTHWFIIILRIIWSINLIPHTYTHIYIYRL